MSNTNDCDLVKDVRARQLSNADKLCKNKNVLDYNKKDIDKVNIINKSAEIRNRIKNSSNIKSKQLNEFDEQ